MNKAESSQEPVIIEVPPVHKTHTPGSAKKKTSLFTNPLFLSAGVVVLVIIAVLLFSLFTNSYRFSFQINSLTYESNYYTPSEFFKLVHDSNNFVVSVELVDGNSSPWTVNSLNLWLIALNADKKHVASLIKTVDSGGNIKSCLTNDANILSSRQLNSSECTLLLSNPKITKINLHTSNENKVILLSSSAEIYAQKGEAFAIVSYSFIKNIYPDFDKTLAIINERINSVN
ncbi:MAG: hypothetical protein WCW13_01985 [archaeon]